MEDSGQALAYARADFSEPHGRLIKLFDEEFPGVEIKGEVLDLGCGPGDMTHRIARRFPGARLIGVDGSAEMIWLANGRKSREPGVAGRITFIQGTLPHAPIPRAEYDAIVSNSLLHHLRRPEVLWETVIEYSRAGTIIFIADLFRPGSVNEAGSLVGKYAGDEPEVLKRDFFNSLLSAFEPEEVRAQLSGAGLTELKLRVVSDRHFIVCGVRAKPQQAQARSSLKAVTPSLIMKNTITSADRGLAHQRP